MATTVLRLDQTLQGGSADGKRKDILSGGHKIAESPKAGLDFAGWKGILKETRRTLRRSLERYC